MTEFRRASNDLKATFEREMHTLERETQSLQSTARQTAREIADHASYDILPSETVWNPLEPERHSAPALEPAPAQDTPATVGASEVLSAESQPATTEVAQLASAEKDEAEPVGIEGTVPRSAPDRPIHS
jgi:sec-independent protein translocase protein TatA